jgi:hypothetical protein
MALGLNDFIAGKFISPLLRPLEGMGPHNGYCLHQKHYVPRKINIMTLIFILSALRGALYHESWGFSGHLTTFMTLPVAKNVVLFPSLEGHY